jgi:subtilase family serine protease
MIRLRGTTHPLINTANDVGRVPSDLPMDRVVLMLRSSIEQEGALDQFLADQQDPASAHYHQWLTPQQFGERFGASEQDINIITNWLQSQGFRIDGVGQGRRSIEFSGTARQIENVFRTEIHQFDIGGEKHTANAVDVSMPEALTPAVSGIVSLHDFVAMPNISQRSTQFTLNEFSKTAFTATSGAHYMTPYDFATIYKVAALWNEGFDGTGQTVAIVGRTNININDVATFRATWGLPANNPEVIVNGPDPGIVSDAEVGEALLDVEWSGAVAPGAAVKLVVTGRTNATGGEFGSALYIVNNKVGSIVSSSFGSCEAVNTPSASTFWNNIWQQAAAQGMSVFVAAGDSGSAGCETNRNSLAATRGTGVNVIASTPYNVAVGGTQFDENGSDSVYWNSTNDRTNESSAQVYIPEVVWNESAAVGGRGLWSGGGGVSLLWPKPSWQTGYGVPDVDPGTTSGHHRYLPDVSLSAAGHDGYIVQITNNRGIVRGTSASSPAFAGIMAIVNQVSKQSNGNPNPRLYALAAQRYQDIFHDVTQGSNAVPCVVGSPDCIGGTIGGYDAHPGYDLATGLGSVDAYSLAHFWAIPTGTITASPCVITGDTCTSTIAWVTQNVSAASVRVSVNGGPEAELAQSISGSVPAPWISTNQYKFVLYSLDTNSALSSATVTGVRPTGTITASPNPCVATSGNSCAMTITWNTQNVASASVRVSVNGGPESEVGRSVSGSVSVPWIIAGGQYKFLLYDLDFGILLNAVTVTGRIGGTTTASGASVIGGVHRIRVGYP